MGQFSVLSIKKQMDIQGEYFVVMIDIENKITRCFLRSELERKELLERLHAASCIQDLYSIDKKAVLYTA